VVFVRHSCLNVRHAKSTMIENGYNFEEAGICFWMLVPDQTQVGALPLPLCHPYTTAPPPPPRGGSIAANLPCLTTFDSSCLKSCSEQSRRTVYTPLSGVPRFPIPRSANSDSPLKHHDLFWKQQLRMRRRCRAPLNGNSPLNATPLKGVYTVISTFSLIALRRTSIRYLPAPFYSSKKEWLSMTGRSSRA